MSKPKPKLYSDGFKCPECDEKTLTVDSRYADGVRGGVSPHRRRRRECRQKHRFTTYESVKRDPPEFTLKMLGETLSAIAQFLIEKHKIESGGTQ